MGKYSSDPLFIVVSSESYTAIAIDIDDERKMFEQICFKVIDCDIARVSFQWNGNFILAVSHCLKSHMTFAQITNVLRVLVNGNHLSTLLIFFAIRLLLPNLHCEESHLLEILLR